MCAMPALMFPSMIVIEKELMGDTGQEQATATTAAQADFDQGLADYCSRRPFKGLKGEEHDENDTDVDHQLTVYRYTQKAQRPRAFNPRTPLHQAAH
jgi:hypothetical protein